MGIWKKTGKKRKRKKDTNTKMNGERKRKKMSFRWVGPASCSFPTGTSILSVPL